MGCQVLTIYEEALCDSRECRYIQMVFTFDLFGTLLSKNIVEVISSILKKMRIRVWIWSCFCKYFWSMVIFTYIFSQLSSSIFLEPTILVKVCFISVLHWRVDFTDIQNTNSRIWERLEPPWTYIPSPFLFFSELQIKDVR